MATRVATRLSKTEGRVGLDPSKLVRNPRSCLSYELIRRLTESSQDAKKIIAVHFANRIFNQYRGFIKYGKMNFRIHTKDNGIVIVIKHEW